MQKTGYCLKGYGKKGTFVINDKDYGEIRKAVDNSEAVADIEVANQLIEKFSSKYSHSDAAKTISKTTVSNILANESKEKYGFSKRPQILSPEGLSGAEKGTALHKFMQYSDFSAASDNLENEIARLYEWEFISEAEADSLDRNAIKEFLNSELCKDMKSAAFTLKEQRVILPYTDQNGIQTVIQGAIDCVYEKDGGIVVVDFKTTKLDTAEQFVCAYKSQLDIYSSAVEEIIGMKVVKKYIYSLHLCKTIEV
jgi:ATP-dependent helicase/nuclease subunit A